MLCSSLLLLLLLLLMLLSCYATVHVAMLVDHGVTQITSDHHIILCIDEISVVPACLPAYLVASLFVLLCISCRYLVQNLPTCIKSAFTEKRMSMHVLVSAICIRICFFCFCR